MATVHCQVFLKRVTTLLIFGLLIAAVHSQTPDAPHTPVPTPPVAPITPTSPVPPPTAPVAPAPAPVPTPVPVPAPVPVPIAPPAHPPSFDCVPCGPGNVSFTGCPLCPIGLCYNLSVCTPCPAGSAAKDPGLSACPLCLAGTYQNQRGQSDCLSCVPGYYCPSDPTGVKEMVPCPPGSRCPINGLPLPIACSAGWYCPGYRSVVQQICPAGSYCPLASANPVECPANNFCPQSSSGPTPCQPLYGSKAGAKTCTPAPSFFVLIFGLITLVVAIGVGIFLFRKLFMKEETSISTKRSKSASERTKLVLSEDDGGYHGT